MVLDDRPGKQEAPDKAVEPLPRFPQPLAQQAGGQDPGIVQNQAVAGIQKVRQLIEM